MNDEESSWRDLAGIEYVGLPQGIQAPTLRRHAEVHHVCGRAVRLPVSTGPVERTQMPASSPRRNIYRHARFNLAALLRLAGTLRKQPCTCDETQTPWSGAFSWAILLTFADGVEWVFRSPKPEGVEISRTTACRVLTSEAATLKCVRQSTSIPVPEVFHYW